MSKRQSRLSRSSILANCPKFTPTHPDSLVGSPWASQSSRGHKSPDPLHWIDQALKNVPYVPVAIPSRHPRAKPITPLDSSGHACQFRWQKSPDPLHWIDQALKNVPYVPVAIPSRHTRAKPIRPLDSSGHARQFRRQKSLDPLHWIDQALKNVSFPTF